MTRIRRILFASDLSKASAKAFDIAVTLATATRAKLTIIHVIAPFSPLVSERYGRLETIKELHLEMRQWSQQEIEKLAQKATRAGVRAAVLIAEGDPAGQIVRAARSTRADLVVVGTHGRTGLTRFVVGSVAARLVATAPCPVVTVPDRQKR